MSVNFILQGAAYLPLLAVRPFMTAFLISLLSWFFTYFPILPSPVREAPLSTPGWFTHPATMGLLFLLAVSEFIAIRIQFFQDYKEFLAYIGPIIKVIMAIAVSLALIDEESAAFVGALFKVEDSRFGVAGMALEAILTRYFISIHWTRCNMTGFIDL